MIVQFNLCSAKSCPRDKTKQKKPKEQLLCNTFQYVLLHRRGEGWGKWVSCPKSFYRGCSLRRLFIPYHNRLPTYHKDCELLHLKSFWWCYRICHQSISCTTLRKLRWPFWKTEKTKGLIMDGSLKSSCTIADCETQDTSCFEMSLISRLFTVPYFFVRSFRYTASYRHGYLDFQMYRGGGRRGL